MKKLLCIFAALLLFSGTAFAANWTSPDVQSPYSVGIIPVKEEANIFGQKTYRQDFGAAQAGDSIAFVVRVEVPENASPALLTVKGRNATVNGVLTASLPSASGVYYFKPDGTFSVDMAPITAYCTGTPTIMAKITGTEQIDSAGSYRVEKDSSGYLFTNNNRGMLFCPDAGGRVYSSFVFGSDYYHRLTAALMAEDGEPAAVARAVLNTLQMDAAALLSGNVYMTDRILASNFGVPVDAETSKTWAQAAMLQPDTSYVPGVPATGMPWDIIAALCALACVAAVIWFSIENKGRKG